MAKVKIHGMGNDGERIFTVLNREEIEELIAGLNPVEMYQKTFEEAECYSCSGEAYVYIDARDGSVHTSWLGQNTFNHPWDSFYEIWLCSLKTGAEAIDLNTPSFLLTDEEKKEFMEYEGSAKQYILEKHGQKELEERKENAIQWSADEFSLDWNDITEQLDELFSHAVE